MFPSYNPFQPLRGPTHPLLLHFLVILSNTILSYKPFQGLGGPTHCIFTFEDEVMKNIMEKQVIPDHQRMKMKISFFQVQLFEFDFKDDGLHNIMNMKISFVQVQVFESGFDFETKIETKLCFDKIYLYPHFKTKICLHLIWSCPKCFFIK